MLPTKEYSDQEKQSWANLSWQHDITAVAAHDMHVIEDCIAYTPPHPAPYASGTKTGMIVVPKMRVSYEMFQCVIDDVLSKVKRLKLTTFLYIRKLWADCILYLSYVDIFHMWKTIISEYKQM